MCETHSSSPQPGGSNFERIWREHLSMETHNLRDYKPIKLSRALTLCLLHLPVKYGETRRILLQVRQLSSFNYVSDVRTRNDAKELIARFSSRWRHSMPLVCPLDVAVSLKSNLIYVFLFFLNEFNKRNQKYITVMQRCIICLVC